MTDLTETIEQVAKAIHAAEMIAILTGAGVSKESGVPTFRDAMEGLWTQYDPQQLATRQAFDRNPKLVWDWYMWRRELVSKAQPNPGHVALAKLQDFKKGVHVITQNVDDLHEQAGSTDVMHLHGNIARDKCLNDCQGTPTIVDTSKLDFDKVPGPPLCPHCGSYIRPNVVWFGESLPQYEFSRATTASTTCDVMLVVGTSGLVNPAALLPGMAKSAKAKVVEVNPDATPLSRLADYRLQGKSGEVLPKVIEALEKLQSE